MGPEWLRAENSRLQNAEGDDDLSNPQNRFLHS